MLNEKSIRAKIGIFAIAVGLIGIIIAFFAPTIMTETLHFSQDNIILLTLKSSLIIAIVSLVLIVAILILLSLKATKVTFSLASLAIVVVLAFCTWSLTNYTAIQKEQIVMKSFNNEQILKWAEIEQVVYEYHDELPYGQYIFQTANEEMVITETAKFGVEEKQKIYSTARSFDVTFTERKLAKE
ncbi:MAG: hypothetical protein ABS942_07005 [Solibacillus sp.]|uniref:hypothetical protein n=1 Tax=Solibacillus sp. TaxID=1909654 RepID=UPI003315055B